jgi:energy-coupling factor transporter ATP-binding protein EcfA2
MSQLVVLVGRRGSGKSTLLTAIALIEEIPFFSNIIIKSVNYHPLAISDLEELPTPSMIIIDEGYGTVDSREAQSTRNRLWSHVAFQLRKRDLTVLIAVQQWSALDIRIRKETDFIVKCEFDNEVFNYSVMDAYEGEIIYDFNLPFVNAKEIFPFFDTNEIVKSELMKDSEYFLVKGDESKYKRRLVEISDEIKPLLEKVHLTTVKTALTLRGIDISWTRDVYNYLKGYIKLEN